MKRWMSTILFSLVFFSTTAFAVPKVGEMAPDFKAKDSQGHEQSLSKYKGKFVVLEWMNHGCPFVKKHYGSGNMQELQKNYRKKGVVWLSIISSAEGKQGFSTPKEAEKDRVAKKSSATAVVLDSGADVAKKYEAKTTPHMFVVDPKGTLIYAGAIDDQATTDPDDVKTAKNYVAQALDEALVGKPVSVASIKPYGCSVKY